MVRRGGVLSIQGETTYKFLNQIQKVKYRLSDFIVGVAKELEKKKLKQESFRPVINHPIPPKPVDIDTNKEARKVWRKASSNSP